MEIKKRFITILTPEGEFIRLPNKKNYLVGEEIFFPKSAKKKFSFPVFMIPKAIGTIAIICILILFTLIPMSKNQKVFAYVSIDINPSIELAINEDLKVINATPFNKEGQDILNQIDNWKGQHFEQVTDKIIDKIQENGWIPEEKHLVIGMVFAVENHDEVQTKVNETIKMIQENIEKEEIHSETITGTIEERKIAVENGKTVGKYFEEKISQYNDYQNATIEKSNISEDPPNKKEHDNNATSQQELKKEFKSKNDKRNDPTPKLNENNKPGKEYGRNNPGQVKGKPGSKDKHLEQNKHHHEKKKDKDKDKVKEKEKQPKAEKQKHDNKKDEDPKKKDKTKQNIHSKNKDAQTGNGKLKNN